MALEHISQATNFMELIRKNHPEAFTTTCQPSNDTDRCPKCGGVGFIALGDCKYRDCECMEARKAKFVIEQSGLGKAIETLTLDSFRQDRPFQEAMHEAATGFLGSSTNWLYLGGQPGCGKTHLCTAVCGELLKRGIPVRYMLWTDQIQRIKAGINDQDTLDELLEPLKHVAVLYVDDLFKGAPRRDGVLCPTDSDKRLAFEIFNHRYVTGLRTVISCEWDMRELIDVDQATFSRVYERCKPYMVYIAPDKAKNWRLK